MNVDYDLYEGETASAQRAAHATRRGTLVYDRGEILTAPGHGRFVARARRRARRWPHDACRSTSTSVLADLRELHERHGGPDGARRLAWSPDWQAAREWLLGKLAELPVDRRAATRPATSGPTLPGDGRRRGSSSSARTSTRCPAGGWLDGALGAADRARRRCARSPRPATPPPVDGPARRLGRRGGRALRAQPARLLGRARARCDPDDVRDLRDARARGCEDALAALRRRPRRAPGAARERLRGRAAPTSSCTSSRGRCCSTPAAWPRRSAARSATSATWSRSRGQAAHAGSTPMRLRRDALAAAATRRARDPRGRHPPRRRPHRRRA